MAYNPQKEVMQKCCEVFVLSSTTYFLSGVEGFSVEVRKGEDLIDPFFFGASIAIQDTLGDDYTIIEGLKDLEPVRDSLGIYYLNLNLYTLMGAEGEYVVIWSIRETEFSNMLGYERIFTVVR